MCLLGQFLTHLDSGAFSVVSIEEASSQKPGFSSCRLTEENTTANTDSHRSCRAKDSGGFIASWAVHIPEVGTGSLLHRALPLVSSPLLERDEGDPQ